MTRFRGVNIATLTPVANFLPILTWLGKVNAASFKKDLAAAFASAVFALPQALAFALIAGLPPEFGLYAALVAPLICVFFGSSWHTVAGPTVSTSIVLFEIISEYAAPQSPLFISYALTLTLMAGGIQLLLGLFRAGQLTNFVSSTVISGFSAGAALLIIGNQLDTFFGLSLERESNLFLQVKSVISNLPLMHIDVFLISVVTFVSCLLLKKRLRRVPYLLVAMLISALLALLIQHFVPNNHIELLGALPSGPPDLTEPELDPYQLKQLFVSSIAIALLGFVQSISIAKSIATRTGQRIDANQEFVSQGLANIGCAFFSSFFSSTSFTRSAINYSSGAQTPLANLLASGMILLTLLYGANITEYLPTASMSAIILLVGWQLIDFPYIKKMAKTSRSELAIFLVTMVSTLIFSLEFAIYSGVILSLILHLQKTAQPKVVSVATDKHDAFLRLREISTTFNKECPQLKIIRIDGSLFFGAIDHVQMILKEININKQNHILIICDGITLIDVSGAELLDKLKRLLQKRGGDLYLSGLKIEARAFLVNSPYWQRLDASTNVFNFSVEAIGYIFNRLDYKKCRYCDKRIFVECDQIEQVKMEFKPADKLINI